jgi:hypothetical protein
MNQRDVSQVGGKIVCVLDGPLGKRVYKTHNIITNAGDIFYAQRMAGETPDNAFANLVLGSSAVPTPSKSSDYDDITPIADTNKAPSAGYPKTDDDDPDNTDVDVNVVTHKYYYAKADFNAASITEGVITIATPEAGSPVLTHFAFASIFEKTEDDTLTVFINHVMLGV